MKLLSTFKGYKPGGHELNMNIFWDYDTDRLVPKDHPVLTVERIIAYGDLEDWFAGFDIFGVEGFARIAKEEVVEMDNRNLVFVCRAFGFNKEDTKCFKHKQSRQRFLNSQYSSDQE